MVLLPFYEQIYSSIKPFLPAELTGLVLVQGLPCSRGLCHEPKQESPLGWAAHCKLTHRDVSYGSPKWCQGTAGKSPNPSQVINLLLPGSILVRTLCH